MLEIYCDSSYNESGDSYIGCAILSKGKQIHQSTTKVPETPQSNLDCELAALNFASILARVFYDGDFDIIIYNDSTEAIKVFQKKMLKNEVEFPGSNVSFEYIPREKINQVVADSLSKRFPVLFLNMPVFEVESFSRNGSILSDIAKNMANVFYLEKTPEKSTNKRTCYKLVIRTIDDILSDDRFYLVKKGGPGTQVKAAEKIRKDLSDPSVVSSLTTKGVRLEGSYFLLTDETWGLRGTDNKAYSILPKSIRHRIICDEVDRASENLFRRAERFR